jgi:wyosine [tRNA(Phe)-imidazoG37] synthetase (radical SAM superfamily)
MISPALLRPERVMDIAGIRNPGTPATPARRRGTMVAGMHYVFGPVSSRRLGRSLGIDPVPLKTCNWNCVYCQLGRTVPLTNVRGEYAPAKEIVQEAGHVLGSRPSGGIDWVTFLGSGEPTLHSALGWMIRQVKAMTRLPVAVLTNGALLYQPEVREELSAADAVLPSLDAGTEALYRAINRPSPVCTFERLVEGLSSFRREFRGRLWVEVMLVKGLNDTEAALRDLAGVLSSIGPDEIHLSTPVRPPAEPWVEPPDSETLAQAAAILGASARVIAPVSDAVELSGYEDVQEAALAVIARHPMTEEELLRTLARWTPGQVREALAKLAASGRAQVVTRLGARFWSDVRARYASPSGAQ